MVTLDISARPMSQDIRIVSSPQAFCVYTLDRSAAAFMPSTRAAPFAVMSIEAADETA
jgi:hypothetical protein